MNYIEINGDFINLDNVTDFHYSYRIPDAYAFKEYNIITFRFTNKETLQEKTCDKDEFESWKKKLNNYLTGYDFFGKIEDKEN